MRLFKLAILATCAYALNISACTSDNSSNRPLNAAGSSGSAGEGGSGNASNCGYTSQVACENTCLNGTCCEQALTCNQLGCSSLIDCVDACESEGTCIDNCANQYPNLVDPLLNMYGCLDDCCAAGGTGGSGAGGSGSGGSGGGSECGFTSSDACLSSCIEGSCCGVGNTCANNSECVALNNCVDACADGDSECIQGCVDAHPNGYDDISAFATCLNGCGCGGA
ncbi:MAG: hypothetical protein H6718_10700 [Polyangiaceae bacterium]|nr:hypothetical protein [Myxococcales bacterium]MCB9585856.1 hypothetical protein [Polyangiaceae bacterium]MCB9607215.1 hypothetical protein [Polyangiaceae bacterium]